MLKSFYIRNFRLFQHLEITRLGRVNLIVGKNNSGKSTFLEAIQVYASTAAANVLINLVDGRQENWFNDARPQSRSFQSHPIRHLFTGHKLPNMEEEGIVLGEVLNDNKIYIGLGIYEFQGYLGSTKIVRTINNSIDDGILEIKAFLELKEGRKIQRLFQIDTPLQQAGFNIYSQLTDESKYLWQIVSTNNMPERKLAALWDLTTLTELESEVISALRLIDDRVLGVTFVEDIQANRERIPIIKIKGVDEPLPLKSMGDGITRLFHIIVALVNTKGGLLLIDEFENGLHWSVQPQVWDIVFQIAEKLNVQVFATTHSRDCIRGFEQVWNTYPDLGAFFRLDNKNGVVKATEYTAETLTDAIDMDVEVR